jgi:hypothetical protein
MVGACGEKEMYQQRIDASAISNSRQVVVKS